MTVFAGPDNSCGGLPGSMHETHTDEGCTLLAIYRKPNVFYKTAGFRSKG